MDIQPTGGDEVPSLPAPASQPPPETKVVEQQPQSFVDKARAAGFSADEIAGWMNKQRAATKAAGFTDEEIDEGIARVYRAEQTPPPSPAPAYPNQGEAMMKALNDPYLRAHPHAMDAALEQINRIAHARRLMEADSSSTYKVWARDNIAEATETGKVSRPIPAGDYVRYLGAEAYQDYQKNVAFAQDSYRLSGMTPEERGALIDQYNPHPGERGYAEGVARRDALIKAANALEKQMQADPAGYTMRYIPAAQRDFQMLAKEASNPAASPKDRQFFAKKFAETMISQQRHIGVAEADISILPKEQVQSIVKQLTKTQDDGGAVNIIGGIKAQADLWGDYWPMIYKDIGKEAGPLFRVLASGNLPLQDAALLAQNAKVTVQKIMGDQDEETIKNLKTAVIDAFRPFAKTVVGLTPDRWQVLDDFIGQAEKLAALYVTNNNMRASAAATAAYKKLVGDAYDFSGGTYRVPKTFTDDDGIRKILDPVEIANGAAAARDLIGTGKLALATKESAAGLSDAYLAENTTKSLKAFGVWVTSDNERGLTLIQGNGWAARGPTGKPITLSWQELAAMGKGRRELPGAIPMWGTP